MKTFLAPPSDDAERAEEERDRELMVLRVVSEAMHAHVANLIAEYESPQGGARSTRAFTIAAAARSTRSCRSCARSRWR